MASRPLLEQKASWHLRFFHCKLPSRLPYAKLRKPPTLHVSEPGGVGVPTPAVRTGEEGSGRISGLSDSMTQQFLQQLRCSCCLASPLKSWVPPFLFYCFPDVVCVSFVCSWLPLFSAPGSLNHGWPFFCGHRGGGGCGMAEGGYLAKMGCTGALHSKCGRQWRCISYNWAIQKIQWGCTCTRYGSQIHRRNIHIYVHYVHVYVTLETSMCTFLPHGLSRGERCIVLDSRKGMEMVVG